MKAEFWHQKWEKGEIGFHESQANALLQKHFQYLDLPLGSRLFLPLCGKTRDIQWLLNQGYRIAGAELSEKAIIDLFNDLNVNPAIKKLGTLSHYSADNIDIFVGDIFKLGQEQLGRIDAIYDRAALVALPETMRNDYTQHLVSITQKAAQLLITFEYDQSQKQGPPFSINLPLIEQCYHDFYSIELLESKSAIARFNADIEFTEKAWILHSKA